MKNYANYLTSDDFPIPGTPFIVTNLLLSIADIAKCISEFLPIKCSSLAGTLLKNFSSA